MGRFAKIDNGFYLLTIFSKRSILHVWQGSKYTSGEYIRHLFLRINPKSHTISYDSFCQDKSVRPKMFCEKGVFKDFVKFTEKHRCWSFFLNKTVGLRPATLLKKRLKHGCSSVDFAKVLVASFFTEHPQCFGEIFCITSYTWEFLLSCIYP